MMRFAHIVNPVRVPESSDLYQAQPITFESMKRAKEKALQDIPDLEITLLSCHYPEDEEMVPEYFEKTPHLTRSVRDLQGFEKQKKLPFIQDLLQHAYQHQEADYIIFTNVDISLYPDFYNKVYRKLEEGFDGLCINRTTLADGVYTAKDLNRLYDLEGQPHEGIDCFILKRTLIPKLVLKESIVGTGPVGLILASNLLHVCSKFIWVTDGKYTFHIGDDKRWRKEQITRDSLLVYSFSQFRDVLLVLLENEHDPIKQIVIQSNLTYSNYLIEKLSLLQSALNRKILKWYSDGSMEKITNVEKEASDYRLQLKSKPSKKKPSLKNRIINKLRRTFK